MPVIIYGIKNCDTMKKARAWLDAHRIDYRFHDYKIDGIDKPRLQAWCRTLGWESVLNKAGTTFRSLDAADKAALNESRAIALMIAQPSMIKRPIAEQDGAPTLVGFKPDIYATAFAVRR